MTTVQVARSEGLHQFGNVRTDYFMTNAGAPLSGTTAGTFRDFAQPGAHLYDTTNDVEYVNRGTKASPYWQPTSYEQNGIRCVHTDFRDVGDVAAVAGSAVEVILESGVRVFGQGLDENDSGLTVAAVAEIGNVATILTTNETAHVIALSMGDTTPIFQPDTNGPHMIEVEFSNASAITARAVFCGFVGAVADALDPVVTGSGTTLTLVLDDLAGMFMDTGLTDADGIFLPHNKSNAAATIATTATGVDISQTMPAAATYTKWAVQISAAGVMTAFIDYVEVGTIAAALDADEEMMPVFYLEANGAAIKSATVKQIAMWSAIRS